MSRYIDAEEVKHIMNEYIDKIGVDVFTAFHITDFMNEATSVDTVPVVRCKNCKYSDVAYCRDHKTISKTEIYCIRDEYRHCNNWFCADGERKDAVD